MKVKTALLFHRNVSATGTTVYVKDGVVTLQGEASSMAQKELTTEYAKDIDNVKEVKNDMTIAKTPAAPDATIGDKIDDASITAEVKSSLLSHHSTSAMHTTGFNDGRRRHRGRHRQKRRGKKPRHQARHRHQRRDQRDQQHDRRRAGGRELNRQPDCRLARKRASRQPTEKNFMLYTIALVLLILWLLGLVTGTTMGGFIHILLVIAIVVVLIRVISGRKVKYEHKNHRGRHLLITLGIVVLAYSGLSFTTPGKTIDFLGMHIATTDNHFIPPVAGALALVGGIVLLLT
jgi:osmotically-inducible protein OsmY